MRIDGTYKSFKVMPTERFVMTFRLFPLQITKKSENNSKILLVLFFFFFFNLFYLFTSVTDPHL